MWGARGSARSSCGRERRCGALGWSRALHLAAVANLLVGLVGLSAVALAHEATAPAEQEQPRIYADFNHDGFCDLAIGSPGEDVGAVVDAGAVNVLYGSAAGLSATGNQLWTQGSGGILDSAEASDQFGAHLAVGDFSGDHFADLAVGVPNEDVGAIANTGAVNVLYGTASGLKAAGNQLWTQDSAGILDASESNDQFGYALACGDFNGNAIQDLAIGAPGEDVGAVVDAGAVNVLYGSAVGLTATQNQLWTQNSDRILDAAEARDHFGVALTVGRFKGGVIDGLAVGVPGEDVGAITDAGAVNVLYGSAAGLAAAGNQLWTQDSLGILDTAEASDQLGSAVSAGDFNADGFADLVAGVPLEDLGLVKDAGAVAVLNGSGAGITSTDQLWTQNSAGILDTAEAGDRFGSSITGHCGSSAAARLGTPGIHGPSCG